MKRKAVLIALVLLCVIGGVAATMVLHGKHDDPSVTPPAGGVDTGQLHFQSGAPQLDYIKSVPVQMVPEPLVEPMTARVAMDENHTARIFSPVTGRVLRILVEPGASVHKGQPLVEIDSPDYATALADTRKAKADLAMKQRAWQREQELFQAGVVARKDLEGAEADYHAAQAEDDRATQSFHHLSEAGGEGNELVLRAPIDGVLANWSVNPGTEVRPDATDPLFVITDTRHLWIVLDAPESALGHLQVGQHVAILSDADGALSKTAIITSLPANIDPDTRRLPVHCSIDNSDGKLRPEMFVRAIPYADGTAQVARVPDTALVASGLYTYAFVETTPGTLQRRRVHVALQGHGESFVDQGLATGDKVVVSGALLLDAELHGSSGD